MTASIHRRDFLKMSGLAGLLAGSTVVLGKEHEPRVAKGADLAQGAFDGVQYTLPDLPYDYGALEPLYEERTLRLHHDKHHAGYVRGLNATLHRLAEARRCGDYSSIKSWSRSLAFHGSGHVLHGLFWHSMTPGGSEMPDSLARAMSESFGSVEAGQAQFAAATKAVEGSGWGVLAYEPMADRLLVLQAEKHQNLTVWGVAPLLVCDVWEHAYYLQYANNRGLWVDRFMELADWRRAGMLYEAAHGEAAV